jgi:hypothetical protein
MFPLASVEKKNGPLPVVLRGEAETRLELSTEKFHATGVTAIFTAFGGSGVDSVTVPASGTSGVKLGPVVTSEVNGAPW